MITDLSRYPSILLRDIWNISYEDLPVLVDSVNCIYLIHNIETGSNYIGKTSWFYNRFKPKGGFTHYSGYLAQLEEDTGIALYRALVKYGIDSFEVYLIESDCVNLDSREVFYIKEFNTYINDEGSIGYNLTRGGENCENLHHPEVYDKNRSNHGGVLAWNTQDAVNKRRYKQIITAIRSNISKFFSNAEISPQSYIGKSTLRHLYRVHSFQNYLYSNLHKEDEDLRTLIDSIVDYIDEL